MNQRQSKRFQAPFMVDIRHPSFGVLTARACDISENGLYVKCLHGPTPPVGTVVEVQVKQLSDYTPPAVDMEVVRVDKLAVSEYGIGLAYIMEKN